MDDFVTRFNERRAEESRAVCERIEREDAGSRVALTERERRVLDMWPRFEDGAPVMIDDGVRGIAGPVQQIRLTHGTASLYGEDDAVVLCDGERARRPRVLDADGAEIRVGDEVWSVFAGSLVPDARHRVQGFDRYGDVLLEFHNELSVGWAGETLTHIRPDSWERLEEDAGMYVCDYARGDDSDGGERLCEGCPYDVVDRDGMGCKQRMARDLVRRAKALAGVAE